MFIRYLDIKAGIPGDITTICFMLFEGSIGTMGLIIYISTGGESIFVQEHFFWVLSAGCLTFVALILQNYALTTGISGVTYSIVNFSVAI